jgi:glycosyltransferase involved in cell wall biosynthesis
MNTIHISVQAYNAEKTLARAIDSILAQTYKDYVIYVCENGSTDNTRAIVDDYAAKGLILPYYNEKNMVFEGKSLEFYDICRKIAADDYFTTLDADDELYPEFFETLLNFANENDLDIAAAAYDVLNIATGQKFVYDDIAQVEKTLILEKPEDYIKNFAPLLSYSLSLWGNLYRGNVSCEMDFSSMIRSMLYGADTMLVLAAVKKAKRIGILPKRLMLYYTGSGNNASVKFDKERIYLPERKYNAIKDILLSKLELTKQDQFVILCCFRVFLLELFNAVSMNLRCDIPLETKLNEIIYVNRSENYCAFFLYNDSFELLRGDNLAAKVAGLFIGFVFENLHIIPYERLRELYYLFFEVIYQAKEPKFTEKEIDYLLEFDIRFINSILTGDFVNAEKWLKNVPEDFMKRRVMRKVRELK